MGLIVLGVFMLALAKYRDYMDSSYTGKYNRIVSNILLWGGGIITLMGAFGMMLEYVG